MVSRLKDQTESILRMQITPEKPTEAISDPPSATLAKRSGSMLIKRSSSDIISPADLIAKTGRLLRNRANSDAFKTLADLVGPMQTNSLEQIEEEFNQVGHGKKTLANSGSKQKQAHLSGNINIQKFESSNDSSSSSDDKESADEEDKSSNVVEEQQSESE